MILCPSAEILNLLFCDELPTEERHSIEFHLEGCLDCQTKLDAIAKVSSTNIVRRLQSLLRESESRASANPGDIFDQLARQAMDAVNGGTQLAEQFSEPAIEKPTIEGCEIFEELGHGGTGTVYRAWHQSLNQFVALKVLDRKTNLSEMARQRFRMETNALVRLQHPNIVQVCDAGEQKGQAYLCLELIEGLTLARWMNRQPRPAEEAAVIIEILAEAVDYAHRRGILHRDLKPANILIGRAKQEGGSGFQSKINANTKHLGEYEIKIADFGLAKVLNAGDWDEQKMTQSGAILGTPAYIAPEQARGTDGANEVGVAVDIYSLGAILYEMLSGRPPFQGTTTIDTLMQVVHHEAVPITHLVPKVPRDLQTICAKCLEKDPQKRYASAAELAADLARFRTRRPIVARPMGLVRRGLGWARRHPVATRFLTGCAILAAGLGSFLIWQGQLNSERIQRIENDLRAVAALQQKGEWAEANGRLEFAEARLGNYWPDSLRHWYDELDATRKNQSLVARLEAIRLNSADFVLGPYPYNSVRTADEYEKAFHDFGLPTFKVSPQQAANYIKKSPAAKEALLAALDHWAICIDDREQQDWLMAVACLTEPDVWSDRVRDPAIWHDRTRQEALAEAMPNRQYSVQLLVAFGERLYGSGADATSFLREVQREYPGDFWANFELGIALNKRKSADAASFFQAALALRPGTAAVNNNLGFAFYTQGRLNEAMQQYQRAIQLDPNCEPAYVGLASVLILKSNSAAAIEQLEQALQLDPNDAWGHYVLGNALQKKFRLGEAINHYDEAIRINPKLPQPHDEKGRALIRAGELDAAIVQFQQSIRIQATYAKSHYNLGLALFYKRKFAASIDEFSQAMLLDPRLIRVYDDLGEEYFANGQFADACEICRQGLAIENSDDPGSSDRIKKRLQRCQQFLILERRLPDILRNIDQPMNPSESLQIAELCLIKHQYVASARLYRQVIDSQTKSSDESEMRDRYLAVCAAALAGSDSEKQATTLSDAERSQWRNQARQWLDANLTALSDALEADTPANKFSALQSMARYLIEPEISDIRDPQLLAGYSEVERQECLAIWNHLARLLEGAQGLRSLALQN